MKTIQAIKGSNNFLEGVSKTIKNERKEQKGGFLGMFLGTLGASLVGSILAGKGIVRAGFEKKKGKGAIAKRQGNSCLWKKKNGFLIQPHPLKNFET